MAQVQQSFVNRKDGPIYISVEPWPECFELEPGERLTLVWNGPGSGDLIEIVVINHRELQVFPNGDIDQIQYLIDGKDAEARSWTFKHC